MAGKSGSYSDVIVYDERKRYYYLHPQKNRPLLDDEIRSMGIGLLDQVRRSVQGSYGDVAVPLVEHAGQPSTSDAFKVVEHPTDPGGDFVVKGGSGYEYPAVMYVRGFYVFLPSDVEFGAQRYQDAGVDLDTSSDKSLTLTDIPAMSVPSGDRVDIVYMCLHFEEVTAASGTDQNVYLDTSLKNSVVGTETANRLRAVFDVRVHEGWSGDVSKNIFNHAEFLGGLDGDHNPTNNEYKVPIAAIYREAGQNTVSDDQIVDLLSLYNKRVLRTDEISHRLGHGGYTQADADERGLTGFQPQFPDAVVDESALAQGPDEGLGPEAFNTDSVTPRVLDKDGKFLLQSLRVGGATGPLLGATGPEGLADGEAVADSVSARSLYLGYGETGLNGVGPDLPREYLDALNVVVQGQDGQSAVRIRNVDGHENSDTFSAAAFKDGELQNFLAVDHRGRVGVNTFLPGDMVDPDWDTDRYNDGLNGATGINIAFDVADSVSFEDHLFVGKDAYFGRDLFGRTYRIPEILTEDDPAMFGFTGIPQSIPSNISGSVSRVFVKGGLALVGEEGMDAYGYTGGQLGYEAYTEDGHRLFTIGDLGQDYDRVIRSLYGTGTRKALVMDHSLLTIPDGYGELQSDDLVEYSIMFQGNNLVTGSLTLVSGGMGAVDEIRDHILKNDLFFDHFGLSADADGYRYARTFQFQEEDEFGNISTKTGTAYGVQIIEDSPTDESYGRIILKDMGEIDVKLDEVVSFRITREGMDPVDVPFTRFSLYGSSKYGGDMIQVKFAKLDLGEAADAWLFNGDVFFSGNGSQNRVTFSPNAIFKNDVYIYGQLYADRQLVNYLTSQNLIAKRDIHAGKLGDIGEALAIGEGALDKLKAMRQTDTELVLFAQGKGMMRDLILRGTSVSEMTSGSLVFDSDYTPAGSRVSVTAGGVLGQDFGFHLYDDRDVPAEDKAREIVVDFSAGPTELDETGDTRAVLRVEGDVVAERALQADYATIGDVDEVNTDYRLQVGGPVRIDDVLEVKALRFTSSEAPEGSDSIVDPSNISVIGDVAGVEGSGEVYLNQPVILRKKEFSSSKKIFLKNSIKSRPALAAPEPVSDAGSYYKDIIKNSDYAKWAKDTISYTEDEYDAIVAGSSDKNTVTVDRVTHASYKKYSCERITIATLGKIIIEWSGYVSGSPLGDCIKSYTFESPYFRNELGGVSIDWSSGLHPNATVRVEATVIDTEGSAPTMYSVNRSLSIFLSKDKWEQHGIEKGSYKNYVLYYPFENIDTKRNAVSFVKFDDQGQNSFDPGWKLALFPRLVKQSRIPVGSAKDYNYRGEWNLDLVILPERDGVSSNLIGKLYIGYNQA